MKVVKIILWIVAILLVAIVGWLYYMGFFSTLKVTEKAVGPYTLVYEDYTGPYSNTGPVVQAVFDRLAKDGIKPIDGFGIYLDDPSKVKASQLRSQVGCVLADKDLKAFKKVAKKYKVLKLAKMMGITTEFPIKNNLSYMIGPMKAYPAIMKYMTEKKIANEQIGTCLEYYDMAGMKITFVFQLKGKH
ncbi:MAG: hypothetical protein WC772_02560 [Candidatus Margulisiibacteriota bacterium]|jgi:hypothetical protein